MADYMESLTSDDKKYVWHPFTQMADWVNDDPVAPCIIDRARGNYLYDVRGKKYLDGVSSLWVTLHGHGKKEIDRAVRAQLKKVAHSTFLGLTHEPAIRLARELIGLAPAGLSRVFYSDNGSTAVEIALKMAYQYWQQKPARENRTTFLSLKNAYHGDTIGSVSVGGMDLFHAKFRPLLFKTIFAPSPYCYRCSFGGPGRCASQCVGEVERILAAHHKKIAAMVVEPMVQGAAGMLTMPPGYLKKIEKLCRACDVLLICDEVATGFGRTGKMFAVEHENVRPDLMCVAKGITGGYLPLAATLASEKIYRAFLGKHEEFKTFFHGHTYTANPLACAAALANLAIFKKEKVIAGLAPKVRHLKNELSSLGALPIVGEIRQIGLMAGIELVKDRKSRAEFAAKDKIAIRICAACRSGGIIIRPLGNVLVLMPPLSVTKAEISKMIATIRNAINRDFDLTFLLPGGEKARMRGKSSGEEADLVK
ncbi:MAG: adenosylmethionine--8-amino-7-oxononanoate transaminase [Elusimicrobia bacterium RIFOXYB2_FULL_50_12]|nr:MAG: adenosylmethionine--8-amino-7-oxononanoate transaminase [Elusimicrobia bacterium RIFOXYB2_FULL_50_12]